MPVAAGMDLELQSCQEFEVLAAELLSTFIGLPAAKLDGAILAAEQRICELLGVDLAGLWQWSAESPRDLILTHMYRPLGGPPVPDRMVAEEFFPWTQKQALAGRIVLLSSMRDLPPEAVTDRATNAHFGLKSAALFPLSAGGGPVFGALGFNMVREERSWQDVEVRRLRLVAEVFAGALARRDAEEAVRESEERLRLAAESADVGLWSMDPATFSFWTTEKAREHFGFSGSDPVTLSRVLAAVVPEDRSKISAVIEELGRSDGDGRVEYRRELPDGSWRWLASRGRARRDASGVVRGIMGVTADITDRKQAEDTMRDFGGRLIRAQEEERSLLARELHDDVTQRLAVLSIDAGRAERGEAGPERDQALRSVRKGLAELGRDVHALAYQLHPSILQDLGLAEAIRTECDQFRRQGRADVDVKIEPLPAVIGTDSALGLFRIAQEALRNVARHAGAHSLTVALGPEGGGLRLEIRDDGAGFDPTLQARRRGLGLESMRERVQFVAGTLRVESAPGMGTSVVAWVPAGDAER